MRWTNAVGPEFRDQKSVANEIGSPIAKGASTTSGDGSFQNFKHPFGCALESSHLGSIRDAAFVQSKNTAKRCKFCAACTDPLRPIPGKLSHHVVHGLSPRVPAGPDRSLQNPQALPWKKEIDP